MRLSISQSVYAGMLGAAQAAAPLEACGLLAGTGERVTKCYVLTNADASAEHFSMLPKEQFAAAKDMREQGLQMLAIWHSHPATPARMSAEDLRLAFTPGVVYVILSLASRHGPAIKGFLVSDGTTSETEVKINRE